MSRSEPLLVAPELSGRAYAQALAAATDAWFADVAEQRLDNLDDVALLAVGGYGRGELCPYSDIDLVLVLGDEVDGNDVAEALWYPAWDRGLDIGYAVVTVEQASGLLRNEFEWSTALLDTRLVAGSRRLHAAIDALTAEEWHRRRGELMVMLDESVVKRHRDRGDAATFIEPHLKEGRGGLRDVHALAWASRATPGFANEFLASLQDEVDILLEARVALHRLAGRRGDVLNLDFQDGVAAAVGRHDTQEYMHQLSAAARRIAWCSDEAWTRWRRAETAAAPTPALYPAGATRMPATESGQVEPSDAQPGQVEPSDAQPGQVEPSETRPSETQPIETQPINGEPIEPERDGPLLVVGNGLLALRPDAQVSTDPLLLLQLAVGAAKSGLIMSRESLAWLRRDGARLPEPWPAEARELFARLFMLGRPAVAVVEDLDQFGLMERLVPEWPWVHCRPQRNVFHTYTVDRHLCEAAVNAADILADRQRAERITRPDLLIVGTLFHDIGKGFPGDHTEVGMNLIGDIGERMGYPANEVGVLVDLCRHHLLLPDVATRRDLSDPGTIKAVAAAVDSVEFLHLLAALTESDSKATGPAAWNSWKAGLLADLVDRTAHVLQGGKLEALTADDFPTDDVLALMAQGKRSITGKDTTFTVVAPDSTGMFSALAGVLAVRALDVLDASSHSEDVVVDGVTVPMAALRFELQPPASGTVDWDRVIDTAERALDGRVSLRARVVRRAAEYSRYRRWMSAEPPERRVVIDNELSDLATVIEVHAPDRVGLLYDLTQVVQELRLNIRSAKIQTLGPQVVDSFYLVDGDGTKLVDRQLLAELELGLNQVVDTP